MAASYDRIAAWYDESVRNNTLIHDLLLPTLLELMSNIAGKHVCDLACRQGAISRLLAQQGAQVI